MFQSNQICYKEVLAHPHFGPIVKSGIEQTVFLTRYKENEEKKQDNYHEISIEFCNQDSIDTALFVIKKGKFNSICVMNLASEFCPGGGYKNSSGFAQEESLMSRTTYWLNLGSLERIKSLYPIQQHSWVIYSPNVLYMRDNQMNLLDWKECQLLNFIAVAGIRKPILMNNQLNKSDTRKLQDRIRLVIKIIDEKKHDCAIFGALGTGAFHGPVKHIAEIFAKVIKEEKCIYLKHISFAILDNTNNNINNKIDLFRNAFLKEGLTIL